MTVAIQISNVGNTDGDEVVIEWRSNTDADWEPLPEGDVLQRGESSAKLDVRNSPSHTEFRIRGIHGTGTRAV